MSPTTLSKSRKKKQRKEQKDALVLLGDSQATHEYEFKDDEELRLESVLFGTPLAGSSSSNGTKKGKEVVDVSMGHLLDEELFFDDSAPAPDQVPQISEDQREGDEGQAQSIQAATNSLLSVGTSRKQAAWVDPDDNQLDISIASDRRLRKLRDSAVEDTISGKEYQSRLRRQFEKVNPVPEWAATRPKRSRRLSQTSVSGSDSDEEVVAEPTTGPIHVADAPTDALPPTELAITRLRDANQASRTDGPVTKIQFHPSSRVPVLMVAGADKRLRLFNVDGLTNPLLQTLHTPALPPNNASFHPAGTSILLSGPRPFICVYDLQSAHVTTHHVSGRARPGVKTDTQDRACDVNAFSRDGRTLAIAGRQGRVRLLDWASVGLIGEIKASASVKSIWWGACDDTGPEMYTLDANAEISTEGVGRYTAIGSKSGIVNVYDTPSTLGNSAPMPLKALPHLTTSVTSLCFNHDAQILASASKTKKDQLKLVHTKTLTTFANWPTSGTPLGHVTTLDFSTRSEYLAIGNTRGNVLLYNLRHYAVAR
ncbi:putative U3 small nucleolar RNA-associated protein 18 Short=U3 snoRNA-associated protein 18 [Rhizoctonia solani AG-1 IB]|uniref:Putative U3 small nucleolar RNA-associated protein 18 Short=U3 snoRNA-associated protein 18 n=1 Tax=Thanatephorus cucumeris (strain AG1-IB / isolate 7/3/14) TaxID=1108050 RepID=M5BLZ0_THACB|nr:putative U3 small nucleolar RNA-associated protein 18 Short=U3 snoRNA-associated protein 18 [Rhizoctonia solani AG-1 IB]